MRRHHVLPVLLLVPVGALAIVDDTTSVAPRAQRTASIAPPAPTGGKARRYAATASYEVSLSGAEQSRFAVTLAADWTLAVAESTAERIVLRGELAVRSMSFASDGSTSTEIPPALGLPHAIELAPDGRLLAIHMSAERDGVSEGIVRSLAGSLQLVERDGQTWETTESDAAGQYVAAYLRSEETVTKTKLRYLPTPRATISELASVTRARRTGGILASLASDERMTTTSGPLAMASHTKIALELTGEVRASLGSFDLARLEKLGKPGASDARTDREIVGGATLDEIVARFDVSDERAQAEIAEKLAALARLDDDAVHHMSEAIRDSTDERTANLLLGALAEAGTPAAQGAIVDLLDTERWPVAHAASDLREPGALVTDALLAKLQSTDPEMRTSSGLALGTAAARLSASAPDRARSIVDEVLRRLAETTDPTAQILMLRILGNAGDPRSLPAIRSLLASPSSDVRRTAVQALRGIADTSVDGTIAAVMHEDRDPDVRRGAVLACGLRESDGCLSALDTATRDPQAFVRIAIVDAVAPIKVPAARAILTRLASDADESVRTEATRALSL